MSIGAIRPAARPRPIARDGANPAPPAARPLTALEKHVSFFDGDGDGKIRLGETKAGLESLGVSKWMSGAQALFINFGLSFNVNGGPGFTLRLHDIHKGKHAADTGTYDKDGHFVSERYERIKTFDADKSGSLSWNEIKALMKANGKNFFGRVAAFGEFSLLFRLAKDTTVTEGGKQVPALSFDRLRQLYDGTLFYRLAGKPLPDWANQGQ
ncbi:MAG: hypothetical protein FJZ01_13880 [Candidatus Sericytochromatia bacterium]|nr:hypothetical protein [Candidatus Tanganyikabacteria bacterium]